MKKNLDRTIAMIDRARRNHPADRYKVFAILTNGYQVFKYDSPRIK